jgi:hypothetical protein
MDFMEYTGSNFDRVIMNPPFEKEQDIDHVRHAFDLLKPGGRLVTIMSEHGFFASDKKAQEFRDWLHKLGGVSEKLEPGEFSGVGAFVPTMVATRIVTIDRPGVFIPPKPKTQSQSDILSLTGPPSYGEQVRLFNYKWIAKKLTGCQLSEQDQLTIFGWRPLREFITLAAIGKKTTVNVCAAGMVPGAYQIVIRTGEGQPITPIMEAAKKVPGMKRVFSKEGGLTYEVVVPEESGQELMWKPQEISMKPARREPVAQGALFQRNTAEMHLDPLLNAIGCTIGIGCLASEEKTKKSKLPVCDGVQKTKRESCIVDVKATLPDGCNSKNWNKPDGEKPENCVNPFAICTQAVGCRIKKSKGK